MWGSRKIGTNHDKGVEEIKTTTARVDFAVGLGPLPFLGLLQHLELFTAAQSSGAKDLDGRNHANCVSVG